MSRDRFKQILRYFHCCDSTAYIPRGEEGHDPLYKVRRVIDILSRNFKDHFKAGCELSIDESMMGAISTIYAKETHKMGNKSMGMC